MKEKRGGYGRKERKKQNKKRKLRRTERGKRYDEMETQRKRERVLCKVLI